MYGKSEDDLEIEEQRELKRHMKGEDPPTYRDCGMACTSSCLQPDAAA
jgi:hypothetical protein